MARSFIFRVMSSSHSVRLKSNPDLFDGLVANLLNQGQNGFFHLLSFDLVLSEFFLDFFQDVSQHLIEFVLVLVGLLADLFEILLHLLVFRQELLMDGFEPLGAGFSLLFQFWLYFDQILSEGVFDLLPLVDSLFGLPFDEIPEHAGLLFDEFGQPGIRFFPVGCVCICHEDEPFLTLSDFLLNDFVGAEVIEVDFFLDVVHLNIIEAVPNVLYRNNCGQSCFWCFIFSFQCRRMFGRWTPSFSMILPCDRTWGC